MTAAAGERRSVNWPANEGTGHDSPSLPSIPANARIGPRRMSGYGLGTTTIVLPPVPVLPLAPVAPVLPVAPVAPLSPVFP